MWTVISVLCPLAVLAVWLAAGAVPWRELEGYFGLLAAGLLCVGTLLVSLIGIAFGALGWIRREPLRYLAVLGLLLNIVTPLWFLLAH